MRGWSDLPVYVVQTRSGNIYCIHEYFEDDGDHTRHLAWHVQKPRGHDVDASAYGMVLDMNIEVGQPLILAWWHKERGMQRRITSPVERIARTVRAIEVEVGHHPSLEAMLN